MNFKQQLLNALQEDKGFRQEVVLLLGEELEMFANLETYKHRIELPEYDTDLIENVDLYFPTSVSDDIRIEAMQEDVRVLINQAFSSIWDNALSRQKSQEINSRNSFKELAEFHISLNGDQEPVDYIDYVKRVLKNIVEIFNLNLKTYKTESKVIDLINDFDNLNQTNKSPVGFSTFGEDK